MIRIARGEVTRLEPLHTCAAGQRSGLPCGQVVLAGRVRRIRVQEGAFDEQNIGTGHQPFDPRGIGRVIPRIDDIRELLPGNDLRDVAQHPKRQRDRRDALRTLPQAPST